MSVAQIPAGGRTTLQPIAGTGTYTLTVPLLPGLYRVTTDTTQSLSTAQIYCATAAGFRFGAAIRGGQGYLSVPETVTSITLSAGTFPLLLGFERLSMYPLIAAPTVASGDVTFLPTNPATMDLAFTLPSGATGIGIYWSNGTFTDLATTTSPKTAISVPGSPTSGTQVPMLVVAKDANGVFGIGTNVTKLWPYTVFTGSGTYATPVGSTSANVLIVGGGGGGGGTNDGTRAGGGGAGRARYEAAVATTGNVSVVVGANGTGSGNANGSAGGQSSFGALTAAGGSGGVAKGAGGNSGAGFTGGANAGGGGAGNTQNGVAGPTGTGGTGSTFFGLQFSGGGGGGSGAGSFGGGNGLGGDQTGATAATRPGSGGGGAFGYTSGPAFAGGPGGAGTVIVEAIF